MKIIVPKSYVYPNTVGFVLRFLVLYGILSVGLLRIFKIFRTQGRHGFHHCDSWVLVGYLSL